MFCFVKLKTGLMFTKKSAAEAILEDTKTAFSGPHEYAFINPRSFGHLDLRFYDDRMAEIESCGFRHIADLENLTLKTTTIDPRTFLRVGLSFDGQMTSAIYQIKPRFWWRVLAWLLGQRQTRVVEFETEFDDGTFVATTNAPPEKMPDNPPAVFATHKPVELPVAALFEAHLRAIRSHAEMRNAKPLAMTGIQEMLDSQHRMETIKSEFRERVGWIKKAEWDRMAGKTDEFSNSVYDEITKIRDRT